MTDGDGEEHTAGAAGVAGVAGAQRAVFISYASQDAKAANHICEALRAARIEVWFDQSELRGGDVWDRQIRQQIHDCRLFVPIVSANTEARVEGYFRREWKLAVDRTHDLSERVAFLVPIVIDSTPEAKADVPDAFRHVQWTRLPGGSASAAFIERIRRLITPVPASALPAAATPPEYSAAQRPTTTNGRHRVDNVALWVLSVVVALGLAYFVADRFWFSKHETDVRSVAKSADDSASNTGSPPATGSKFIPPPHSVAVLPFVNMSGDKEQEYFSEGLTEEILNSLARIDGLQVSARTSSFAFKGKDTDIGTIARRLNVGAILEGSVRRSAHTLRVTAQLNNALTGFHLWSQTYDRDLGDVLQLQTEIATAVASALSVSLLGDTASKIELGGTRNPGAFDAYVRAQRGYFQKWRDPHDAESVIAAYSEAIRLDPRYALAFAGRSFAYTAEAIDFAVGAAIHSDRDRALADARQALVLVPGLAEGHLGLASYLQFVLEFERAGEEFERARALAPGDARVLRAAGGFAVSMGRTEAGLAAINQAVARDPVSPQAHEALGGALYTARRYPEAVTALQRAIRLDADMTGPNAVLGLAYYELGDFQAARASCEATRDYWVNQLCLAVVYEKLGRHADAQITVDRTRAMFGDASAYEYAATYTQWGDLPQALAWLEKALRLRDGGLIKLKTDPLMDPLRKEPRFQAIERALKFPAQL